MCFSEQIHLVVLEHSIKYLYEQDESDDDFIGLMLVEALDDDENEVHQQIDGFYVY
jgi:hypothetical protein